jgi:hypothetical protein
VCDPSARAVEYAFGLVQSAKEPESILHENVLPGSFVVKAKLGVASFVNVVGVDVSVAVGATVSIVHANVAAAPVFPAASVALTAKV